MEKLNYSISINAPREHVWNTMLQDETYRQWTTAFSEESHYEGNWEEGSKILFLDGKGQGMVSRIARNKPHEFISIEHLGFIINGKEDNQSDDAKAMAGALENYTFSENGGVTELRIDMDSDENIPPCLKICGHGRWKNLKSFPNSNQKNREYVKHQQSIYQLFG